MKASLNLGPAIRITRADSAQNIYHVPLKCAQTFPQQSAEIQVIRVGALWGEGKGKGRGDGSKSKRKLLEKQQRSKKEVGGGGGDININVKDEIYRRDNGSIE